MIPLKVNISQNFIKSQGLPPAESPRRGQAKLWEDHH